MIIGLSLVVYGVLFYYGSGSYVFIGLYNGLPVAQYRGNPIGVLAGFLLLGVGVWFFFKASMGTPRFTRLHLTILLATITIPTILVGAGLLYHDTSRFFYGGYTDAYILQVAAAKTLVEGGNPYHASYRNLLYEYIVTGKALGQATWLYRDPYPPYSIDEVVGFVDIYDYPPAGFLYYVPPVLLGLPGVVWDGFILGLGLGLFYYRLRDRFARSIYLLIIGLGGFSLLVMPLIYTGLPGWITPFIIALLFPGNPWLSGLLLGWIISYRPYTLVYVLFYFVMYFKEGYDWRKLLVSATLVGALINLPFFLMDPSIFIDHVLAPLNYNLYPFEGFGLSSLYYLGIYLSKQVCTGILFTLLILLLIIYYKYYVKLRILGPLLPMIVLLAYYRPLYGYYLWAPYFVLIAYVSGFYHGEALAFFKGFSTSRITVLGLLGVFTGAVASGYALLIGVSTFIDLLSLTILLIIPVILWITTRWEPEPLKPLPGFLLIMLLIVIASVLVLFMVPRHYMIVIDRGKPSPMDQLGLYSVNTLFQGLNPYLGLENVLNNITVYRVYIYDHGFKLLTSYPPMQGHNVTYYTGLPGLLIAGSFSLPNLLPAGLLSSIALSLSLLYVGLKVNSEYGRLIYGFIVSTLTLFVILFPSSFPLYTWFIVFVLINYFSSNRFIQVFVEGLLFVFGLAGLFLVIYRWVSGRVYWRKLVWPVITSILILVLFLPPNPLVVGIRYFSYYIFGGSLPVYSLSYLVPLYTGGFQISSPLILLLGLTAYSILLLLTRRGLAGDSPSNILFVYGFLPENSLQLYSGPAILLESLENKRSDSKL